MIHRMLATDTKLLSLLQICDTGFPTGGFSHSLGLEAAIQVRIINNKESLKRFVYCCLENAGSFAMPFMKEAQQQFTDINALMELDELCEACTTNHVARRASIRQGCSMLDTSLKVFKDQRLQPISDSLPYKHHPIIFGVICGALGIDLQSALQAFLFTVVKTVLASAVRLDKVGPVEAQAIQLEVQQQIPSVISRNKQRMSQDACLAYPHVDVVQNVHDTMFTKLFYS